MASALFASRNEPPPHWGERERNVYMRKTPNNSAPIGPPTSTAPAAAASSSNPNPNNHNSSSSRHYPAPAAVPSSNRRPSPLNGAVGGLGAGGGGGDLEHPEDCSSFSHKGGGNGGRGGGGGSNHHHSRHLRGQPEPGGYLAFRVAEFSRSEVRDLRRRLASELERVREISTWIGSRDLYPGAAAARSAAGSASESYGGVGEAWEVTSSSGPRQVHPRQQQQQPSWGEHPSAPPRFDGSKDRSAGPKPDPASRLPPAEVHQPPNRKGGSSTKRPPPPASFVRDPKRPNNPAPPAVVPAAAPAVSEISTPSSELMKQCSQILTKLMKHKHGWVFNRPVDAVGMGLHDYHQIVKRPMDLGTVKSKLKKKAYATASEFAADVRLTFNNALLYNPEGHDVNTMAGQMLRLFEDLYGAATEKYDKDTRRSGAAREPDRVRTSGGGGGQAEPQISAPMGRISSQAVPPMPVAPPVKSAPTPRPHPPAATYQAPPPPQPQPQPPAPPPPAPVASLPSRAPVAKLPKPKAKDPNKREMSYEEKQKLSAGLQSLPDEKMTQVLQIVRRRNPEPAQDGDEIELDFEALDTETLWELDRFVGNCKKALSKIRRQEAIAAAAGGAPSASVGTSQGVATNKADDSSKVQDAAEHQQQQQQRDAPAEPAPANKNRRSGGGEAGDEDVDIGEDMPSTHFPSVEIERDEEHQREEDNSSSSSESSSGGSSSSSSSSDSDSASSSDSDSDADDARSPAPPGGSRPQAPPR